MCSNSTEDTVEALIVNVCISLSPQDFDPRRIRGSGNICYTGMDEEEVEGDVCFCTFVLSRNPYDSSVEVNNSGVIKSLSLGELNNVAYITQLISLFTHSLGLSGKHSAACSHPNMHLTQVAVKAQQRGLTSCENMLSYVSRC